MKTDNFFKTPIKFYFISIYFFILIFIMYFFISNIVIVDKIKTTGILKDYVDKSFVFSEYNGIVEEIFIEEGDFVKENEAIGIINILDIVLMVNLILSEDYSSAADINSDDTINVLDVVLLINIILGN